MFSKYSSKLHYEADRIWAVVEINIDRWSQMSGGVGFGTDPKTELNVNLLLFVSLLFISNWTFDI